jgi:uncharacterized protein (TIGR03032 family)
MRVKTLNQNKYSFSKGFAGWLGMVRASLAFSTYDAGAVYFVGLNAQGNVTINTANFNRPMGLATNLGSLWIGTAGRIWRYENSFKFGQFEGGFDAVYLPRVAYQIGACDAHEIVIEDQDTALFANTRFSCVSAISDIKNFSVRWKPDFISKIVPEDRCHLNGICERDGELRYVTLFANSDAPLAWKANGGRANGGIVLDIKTGEAETGLSMPHSPRWHMDAVYYIDSGIGQLRCWVPGDHGKNSSICFLPGFGRGLSFIGKYAVVTVSKPRDGIFHGLELQRELAIRNAEPWCAVLVIDLEIGGIVEWMQIDGQTRELFDVAVLPFRCPNGFSPDSPQALNSFVGVNEDAAT